MRPFKVAGTYIQDASGNAVAKIVTKEYLPTKLVNLLAAAPEMLELLNYIETFGAVKFSQSRMGSLRHVLRKVRGD